MKPEIGQVFEMKLDGFLDNTVLTYEVLDLNVKDDSHGTIKLKKIRRKTIYMNHEEIQDYKLGETMTVEEQWFTANPKRKIKVI